jgi:hypothetical protein
MFSLPAAIVIAILIDRLCTQRRINSTPFQFASLGTAVGGELATIGILNYWVFPKPGRYHLGIDIMVVETIGWIIAASTGLAGALAVYLYLRMRAVRNPDYDDLQRLRTHSDIADIQQPRDSDNYDNSITRPLG